ncbi:MAG: DUF2865 domain-containing protein, partial [Pseudomonadota bacterium]
MRSLTTTMSASLVVVRKPVSIAIAVAALGTILATSDSVHAQSEHQACPALRHQLDRLPTVYTNQRQDARRSPEYRRFSNREARQERELREAVRRSRRIGCVTRIGNRAADAPRECRALSRRINDMETRLEAIRDQMRAIVAQSRNDGVRDQRAQRNRLLARMQNLNCSTTDQLDRQARTPKKKKKRGFFARLFGIPEVTKRYSDTYRDRYDFDLDGIDGGVYRTLCVRVCDGYYFPVSFATVRSSFDTDQAICQASSPQTEMQLYVHLNPGESTKQMVDVYGNPYSDLPNAFRYRREFVDDPLCPAAHRPFAFNTLRANIEGQSTFTTRVSDGGSSRVQSRILQSGFNTLEEVKVVLPAPEPRPDPYADPDTQLAIAGDFELRPLSAGLTAQLPQSGEGGITEAAVGANADIRIVGPTFLADQEAVRLLQAPDLAPAPSE